jgi:hypothetical protein
LTPWRDSIAVELLTGSQKGSLGDGFLVDFLMNRWSEFKFNNWSNEHKLLTLYWIDGSRDFHFISNIWNEKKKKNSYPTISKSFPKNSFDRDPSILSFLKNSWKFMESFPAQRERATKQNSLSKMWRKEQKTQRLIILFHSVSFSRFSFAKTDVRALSGSEVIRKVEKKILKSFWEKVIYFFEKIFIKFRWFL